MSAAAPRPRRADPEALVARAVEDGRLVESRRGHWMERLRREGAPAERLLESLTAVPLAAAGPSELSRVEEDQLHSEFMTRHFRGPQRSPGRPAVVRRIRDGS